MMYEACVCGGVIMADPTDIQAAVARHNMSLTHSVWRYRTEGPTATTWARDVSAFSPRVSIPRKVGYE